MSYKCDKCGKQVQYIKYTYDNDGSEVPTYYSYTVDLADGKDFYNYELCKECYDEVVKNLKPTTKEFSMAVVCYPTFLENKVLTSLYLGEYSFITLTDVKLPKLKPALETLTEKKNNFLFANNGDYTVDFTYKNIDFTLVGNVFSEEVQIKSTIIR